MRHLLKASPDTVHWGHFDANLEPVLRVKSGDTIEVYTLAIGTPDFIRTLGYRFTAEMRAIVDKVKEMGPGPHILTGPIYVEGASPGDTLEISLLEIEPWYDYGINLIIPGIGVLPEDYPNSIIKCIPIDIRRRVAMLAGVEIPIRPFFGVLAVAPSSGRITSNSVGLHGGNLDNKELVASTKVYLPVQVDGALFSIGDGHACQGDGEVDITALETSMRAVIQLSVKKGFKIKLPMAETKGNFILMAFAPTLDGALKMVVKDTVEFLVSSGFDKDEAYMFCSLCVDFRISQAVGELKGVHAMLPKKILQGRIDSLFWGVGAGEF